MRRRVLSNKKYLKVTPVEVQWVNVDMPASYQIKSNTNWNIV